ncbi:MAG: universal stress protein [Bacillota bacterium]
MEKILVAVDGSEHSHRAVKQAIAVADSDTELTLINVITEPIFDNAIGPFGYAYQSSIDKEQLDEIVEVQHKKVYENAEKILSEAEEELQAAGLEAEKVIKSEDSPANIICDVADEEDYDLIVMADKGRGNVQRVLIGSTCDKVIRHSKVPVLIAK